MRTYTGMPIVVAHQKAKPIQFGISVNRSPKIWRMQVVKKKRRGKKKKAEKKEGKKKKGKMKNAAKINCSSQTFPQQCYDGERKHPYG